jgi:hypothetical protein
MTHLARDELRRWWNEGADADRDRIVGHLSVCDRCAVLYGEVIDEQMMDVSAADAPPELLAAGYAAYRPAATPPRRPVSWRIPRLAAMAAAAAVVLAVLSPFVLRRETSLVPPDDQTIRSSVIQPLSPVSEVTGAFAFEWSSPIAADAYELVVYRRDTEILWMGRVTGTRFQPTAELLNQLEPGTEYSWQVTGIGGRGERTIQSPRQRFLVNPRAPSTGP